MEIRVTGIDRERTKPYLANEYEICFTLSEAPPAKWVEEFEVLLDDSDLFEEIPLFVFKGKSLLIVCPLSQLEAVKDLVNRCAEEANRRFNRHVQTDAERRARLDDVLDRLIFD